MIKYYLLFSAIFFLNNSFAQIKAVSVQLQYDNIDKKFNCYLIVNEGEAISPKNRIQYNSQISIITPKETEMKIVASYNPLQDNAEFNGINPLEWYIGNSIKNIKSLQNANIFSIIPDISPTAYYHALRKNSIVKLFSFTVNPMPICAEGVRLFDSLTNDKLTVEEKKGGDFENSIVIGGLHKIECTISETTNTLLPYGETRNEYLVNSFETLVLKAGEWVNAEKYYWITPQGLKSNVKDHVIKNVKLKNSGIYKLIVSSHEGCISEREIRVIVNDIGQKIANQEENWASIGQKEAEHRVKMTFNASLYPNPANEYIILNICNSSNKTYNVDLLDGTGRFLAKKVISERIEGDQFIKQINLNLNLGIYFLRLTVENYSSSYKFLILN